MAAGYSLSRLSLRVFFFFFWKIDEKRTVFCCLWSKSDVGLWQSAGWFIMEQIMIHSNLNLGNVGKRNARGPKLNIHFLTKFFKVQKVSIYVQIFTTVIERFFCRFSKNFKKDVEKSLHKKSLLKISTYY